MSRGSPRRGPRGGELPTLPAAQDATGGPPDANRAAPLVLLHRDRANELLNNARSALQVLPAEQRAGPDFQRRFRRPIDSARRLLDEIESNQAAA